jgi:capsid assembly protease
MRDYARVMAKIYSTPWLITADGLTLIMDIVHDRMHSPTRLSDEEIARRIRMDNGNNDGRDGGPIIKDGVGILPLCGPIFGKANMMTELSGATSMEAWIKDFRGLLKNSSVKSILLDVDSPGGTDEMIDEVATEIRASRDVKPINAIANNMMASAAYYLASQASKLYSTPSGMVGSIGVYSVHEDRSAADAQHGYKYTFISAGKYKTEGNPHKPLSEEGAEYRQEVVDEVYDEFVTAVSDGRGVSKDTVIQDFGQGRVFKAKRALDAGMVDGIMHYESVLQSMGERQTVQVAIGGKILQGQLAGNMLEISMEEGDPFADPGMPPDPKRNEDDSADGSRVDTPPPGEDGSVPSRSDTVTKPHSSARANKNGRSEMTEDQLKALRAKLGIGDDIDIVAHVESMVDELEPLRQLRREQDQRATFAEQYPEEFARMQRLEARDREHETNRFRDHLSNSRFSRVIGSGDDGTIKTEPTTLGLTSLSIESLVEASEKINNHTFTIADFRGAIDSMMNGGTVDYGNKGSELAPSEDDNDDTVPAGGTQAARKMFADKVREIKEKDSLDDRAALAEAAKRYPQLFDAWRKPPVADRA